MKKILKKLFPIGHRETSWNFVIDKAINPLREENLSTFTDYRVFSCTEEEFWRWLRHSDLREFISDFPHKKALEFFFSSKLLDIDKDNYVLDAAGGRSGYLKALKRIYGCRHLYLSDHIYSGVKTASDGITIVGGDISKINFPASSINKISCHHAFEHFQYDKDIGFISEIGRLLKPGGRACIIPLFLTDSYAECWNIEHAEVFDNKAKLVVDKSASIPGADEDGHFARFYDGAALNERLVSTARNAMLNPTVVTCRFDGKDLPDMEKNFGSKLNCPLRALVLDKLT